VVCTEVCRCSPPPAPESYNPGANSEDPEGCDVPTAVSTSTKSVDFTAYPVPFENEVNIKYSFDYDTKVTIDVYDVKGTLVKQAVDANYVRGTVGRSTIDLSKQDNQMYFVRLTTNEGTVVKKIISTTRLD